MQIQLPNGGYFGVNIQCSDNGEESVVLTYTAADGVGTIEQIWDDEFVQIVQNLLWEVSPRACLDWVSEQDCVLSPILRGEKTFVLFRDIPPTGLEGYPYPVFVAEDGAEALRRFSELYPFRGDWKVHQLS